jgi:hypothetical protein
MELLEQQQDETKETMKTVSDSIKELTAAVNSLCSLIVRKDPSEGHQETRSNH